MSTITPSLEMSLAMLEAVANKLDQGGSNATFAFYSSAKPANINIPADETKRLVTMTLPKPCFKQLNIDSIELKQTDAAMVLKDGIALWARLYSGSGSATADFAVGDHIALNNPELKAGSTLMLSVVTFKPPLQ